MIIDSKVFSVVVLRKGFHVVPVAEEDIYKTAVTTPFGLFEFTRMPFRLKNAPQAFQMIMNEVLRCLDFVFIYLGDILIASTTIEEHEQHVRMVVKRLYDNDITFNPDKCQFAVDEVKYLGYLISAKGIKPLPRKVASICKYPRPQDVLGPFWELWGITVER